MRTGMLVLTLSLASFAWTARASTGKIGGGDGPGTPATSATAPAVSPATTPATSPAMPAPESAAVTPATAASAAPATAPAVAEAQAQGQPPSSQAAEAPTTGHAPPTSTMAAATAVEHPSGEPAAPHPGGGGPSGEAGSAHEAADVAPHPYIPEEGIQWPGTVVRLVILMFVAAALVGPMVRAIMPREVPVAHSHDEPPGESLHHGHSGTLNPEPGHEDDGHGHHH